MKILFLNPIIHAEHKTAKSLQNQGIAILFAENRGEAWEILRLHGSSIDLAIIHREGKESKDSGLKLLEKVKATTTLHQLPIILTTDDWSDADCALHQQGPQGVNAYLHVPFTDVQLIQLIGEILGPDQLQTSTAMVLEDASQIMDESAQITGPKISLEAPDLNPEAQSVEGTLNLATQTSGANPTTAIDQPAEFVGTVAIDEAPAQNIETVAIEADQLLDHLPEVAVAPLGDPSSETRVVEVAGTDALMIPTMAMEAGPLPASGFQPEPESPATRVLDFGTQKRLPAEGTQVIRPEDMDALPMTGFSLQQLPDPEGTGTGTAAISTQVESESEPEVNPAEMPYLFNGGSAPAKPPLQPPAFSPTEFLLHHPIGDAVVPGGAANSPDLEVMRRYLVLREQDVVALSNQLKDSRDHLSVVEQQLQEERMKTSELTHISGEQKQKIEQFETTKKFALENLETQVSELQFEVKVRTDKVKLLESQIRDKADEMTRLKERVRGDIRKIRVREKELENQLELSKKDSESLIISRESKIIELKRKLDLLEFNMDLLQDQYDREKENSAKMKDRLTQAAQIVRMAEGLLDSKKISGGSTVDNTNEQKAS